MFAIAGGIILAVLFFSFLPVILILSVWVVGIGLLIGIEIGIYLLCVNVKNVSNEFSILIVLGINFIAYFYDVKFFHKEGFTWNSYVKFLKNILVSSIFVGGITLLVSLCYLLYIDIDLSHYDFINVTSILTIVLMVLIALFFISNLLINRNKIKGITSNTFNINFYITDDTNIDKTNNERSNILNSIKKYLLEKDGINSVVIINNGVIVTFDIYKISYDEIDLTINELLYTNSKRN